METTIESIIEFCLFLLSWKIDHFAISIIFQEALLMAKIKHKSSEAHFNWSGDTGVQIWTYIRESGFYFLIARIKKIILPISLVTMNN